MNSVSSWKVELIAKSGSNTEIYDILGGGGGEEKEGGEGGREGEN